MNLQYLIKEQGSVCDALADGATLSEFQLVLHFAILT